MSDDPTVAGTAYEALNKINAHEQLCTERYNNINMSLGDVKTGLKWLGGMMLSVLLAILGWSLMQQVNTVNRNQDAVNRQMLDMRRDYPAHPEPQGPVAG